MEKVGEITYNDRKPIDFVALRARCKGEIERCNYSINVIGLDDRAHNLLFTASNVTLDPRFILIDKDRAAVRLRDIKEKTIVFCPRHEMKPGINHNPSAFVGFTRNGRRFLHCSGKDCNAMSVMETVSDVESWGQFGLDTGCVDFINVRHVTLGNLFRST